MPRTGCEPPCLFGRKSVHKSGCFRVSSVKYDNRCEKDGELSVGEVNPGERERGRLRWVNLGASTYPRLFSPLCGHQGWKERLQPFPREHPSILLDSLEHKFLWESLRITRANVQRINSWVSELASWINMFCVASPRFVLVPGNVSRCLFFFPRFYLSTWIVVNRKFIISLNKKARIICFANNRVVKIFNPFQNNFHVTDIIEISINWLIVVEKGINFPCFI